MKKLRPNISHIYSDANSCYDVAFAEMKIPEKHTMTKRETHLIESSNSSIRDNLARFNRKTKRFSKTFSALNYTLKLFFYKDFFFKSILFDTAQPSWGMSTPYFLSYRLYFNTQPHFESGLCIF